MLRKPSSGILYKKVATLEKSFLGNANSSNYISTGNWHEARMLAQLIPKNILILKQHMYHLLAEICLFFIGLLLKRMTKYCNSKDGRRFFSPLFHYSVISGLPN
jgi:hypothetical protein